MGTKGERIMGTVCVKYNHTCVWKRHNEPLLHRLTKERINTVKRETTLQFHHSVHGCVFPPAVFPVPGVSLELGGAIDLWSVTFAAISSSSSVLLSILKKGQLEMRSG